MENTNTPNEQQVNQQFNQQFGSSQIAVPNSAAVLVLGIISLALCWCYGIVGLTCGIIAIVLSSKGKKEYESNPGKYTESSFKNLKAGRICGIIGVSLSALYVVFIILYLVIIGTAFSMIPWQNLR